MRVWGGGRGANAPEAEEEVETLGFLCRTPGQDVRKETKERVLTHPSAVNSDVGSPRVIFTGRQAGKGRRQEKRRGGGRTEVSKHLRIENRDEVAERRQLLLHPRLVTEEVLLLLEEKEEDEEWRGRPGAGR